MTSGRRLAPRAASVVLAVAVVLIGFLVVVALRSRSDFHPAPADVETPRSATSIAPPPPMPVTTIAVPSAPPLCPRSPDCRSAAHLRRRPPLRRQ
ncbi:hypothetical protein I552_0756 [Mycobacterium xenopi 3993]|nr:hypothetical protein I552_0756 [Mycobacterium xenopi 3993]